jgi:anti-anti-sigma factor
MILVTVGTEQFPFNALMNWVDVLIKNGFVESDEEIVVQYGSSTKIPDQVKVFNRLPESKFRALIAQARLVISHCGEGSALLLESYYKPHILVPRTQRFGEHVDDHQLEMADAMEKQGVYVARSPGDLVKFLSAPKVAKVISEKEQKLCQILREHYDTKKHKKLMVVCSSGGHFKYAQSLQPFWEKYENVSWVTFRSVTTESELRSENAKTYWAHSPTNRNLPNLIRNLILAFKVLKQEKPDLIVSTGAGVSVPFLLIGKFLYNSKIVFVESKTRIKELSLSARILQSLSALDKLIVRSKEIATRYPKAEYIPVPSSENSPVAPEDVKTSTIFSANGAALLNTPHRLGILEADKFHSDLEAVCQSKPKKIVLDMSATKYIDSAGLGALVSSLRAANSINTELVLWSVTPEVMSVLNITKYDETFTIEKGTEAVRTHTKNLNNLQQKRPLQNPIQRGMDILVASLGLLVTAILLLPIGIAIKLESSGPIFSGQFHRGYMGKRFRIWKFRTTRNNFTDESVEQETRVGSLLAKTKLDKLPLFWNLLVGDMSLAGPPAATENEVNSYSIKEWSYLDIKPGIVPILFFGNQLFEAR